MKKKLILVSAPPASGKTYVSMKLAENLKHVVYLDKDTLVPLIERRFQCGQ
jgi:tRNA A37 N6-isopentenylltransferase MiaA